MNNLATIRDSSALAVPDIQRNARTALGLWLASYRSENTRRAYRREIEAFARFTGKEDVTDAIAAFLALDDGPAHAIADAWRTAKLSICLSPSAINRSMAALNSLVASARRHGFTTLRLEAKGERSQSYRDTRGPGIEGIQQMLARARRQDRRKAARDEAIIRLAFGLGLRRGEIAELNIGHADLDGGRLSIMGKGRAERELLTLPGEVTKAIERWLSFRNSADPDEALFISLSSGQPQRRISGAGVYHLIATLGERVGVKARPHGLRHTAVTEALNVFSGDYRKVRAFSRHSSLDIVRRYDDNRADHGGQVAAALSAIVS
jgi:integrase/recombinase XerC